MPEEELVLEPLEPLPKTTECFELEEMSANGGAAPGLEPPMEADGGLTGINPLDSADAGVKNPRLWAPELLSETGCFEDTATLTLAAGIFRYEMNAPLWTDGAIKQRFVALPKGERIGIEEDGLWNFPVGSVLIKNFIVEFVAGDVSSRKPVETRLGVRAGDRWHFYSYAWNEDATDAELLAQREWRNEPITVDTPQGKSTFMYLFPNESSCLACHGSDARGVVGPRTAQLNRMLNYGGVVMNQLDALDQIGAFKEGLSAAPAKLEMQPDPADPEAAVEDRARSYLDANCAHCHRPGGWVPSELRMDLRFTTEFADSNICNVSARYGNSFLYSDRIRAGDAESSVIWRRMQDLGLSRMPMLGTVVLDPAASVVEEWINSLTECPTPEGQ